MRIDSNKLKQELKQLYCEMGFIKKSEVNEIIIKLENEEKENSEFYRFLEKL